MKKLFKLFLLVLVALLVLAVLFWKVLLFVGILLLARRTFFGDRKTRKARKQQRRAV